MFEKIVDELKNARKPEVKEIFPSFSGKVHIPVKVELENFSQLHAQGDQRIAFVDGGNAELLGKEDISLSFVRTSFVIFQNKKRLAFRKHEFLILARPFDKEGGICYRISFFPFGSTSKELDLFFDSMDETLRNGVNQADICAASNAARRFLELRAALSAAKEKLADIIVIDGTLMESYTHEGKFLSALADCCEENKILLCSISKTSSLLTNEGMNFARFLQKVAPFEQWIYHPVAEMKNEAPRSDILFVKFHSKAKHAFRFEILSRQKEYFQKALSNLALYCHDPIFLGYPYGLIEADRLARVTNHEKASLRSRLSIELNADVLDAHEILDKISF